MSTTSTHIEQARPSRALRLALVLLGLLVLLAVNAGLTHVFSPYGGQTDAIWAQYRKAASSKIDTIIIGSSYTMQSMDPDAIDPVLGSSSFMLATPSQSHAASLVALKDAYEDHHIKRAIMGVAVGNVVDVPHEMAYDIAFNLAESQGRPLEQGLAKYLAMMANRHYRGNLNSLAALMPWTVYNGGLSLSAAKDNLKAHEEFASADEAAERFGLHYESNRGFARMDGVIDVSDAATRLEPAEPADYIFDEDVKQEFLAICDFCREKGIELYFVVTPRPAFSLIRYDQNEGYIGVMQQFKEPLEAAGAHFIDFTLARPELLTLPESAFHDAGHLNYDGAQLFGPVMADTIKRMEEGEELSALFYPYTQAGWNEWLANVKEISLASYSYEVDGNVHFTARAYAGSEVKVEYEYLHILEDGSSEVLRPYSTDPSYTMPTEGKHGAITVRMNARQVGATDAERSCERTLIY